MTGTAAITPSVGSAESERLPNLLHPGTSTTFFDGLRGLAALYVLMRHALVMLMSYGRTGKPEQGLDRVITIALGLLSYPHVAVLFFFVLSGFVIHLRYARALQASPETATFGWGQFMWRRIRRLYPPLIAAVILTGVVDHIGLAQNLPIYRVEPGLPHTVVTPRLEWTTLLGNLVFLNNLMPGINDWGTDTPLWSLALEWWFYCLYPLFWRLTRRSIGLATGAVIVLYFVALAISPYPWLRLPSRVLSTFPLWWTGALLADVYAKRIKISYARLAPLALLLVLGLYLDSKLKTDAGAGQAPAAAAVEDTMAPTPADQELANPTTLPTTAVAVTAVTTAPSASRPAVAAVRPAAPANATLATIKKITPRHIADMVVVLGVAGLLCGVFALQLRGWSFWILERLKPLGDMSYTLYLIHMPIVVYVGGVFLAKSEKRQPPHSLIPWLLTCIGCVVLAYLIHLVAERPFSGGGGKHKGGKASTGG